MKAVFCFLFFALLYCSGYAQVNYVLNPSFEQHTGCPEGPDAIRLATYWSAIDTIDADPLCSPEYCNACSVNGVFGVPAGEGYYHYPRTGTGMALVYMFFDESFVYYPERDYLQGHLFSHLTAGKAYCVTFYVTSTHYSEYAIDHIGAYLDNGTIDTASNDYCARPQTEYLPQVFSNDIINDTLNWVKIEGSFTANGTERFITIGNFFDKAHTNYVAVPYSTSTVAYYLVDDISVLPSAAVPHLGGDVSVVSGDSMFIGPHEVALPYTWYIKGNPAAIDSGGGIWVKPDTTTTYVVEQTLCGLHSYDTITVHVVPVAVSNLNATTENLVYPNPAKDVLNVIYSRDKGEIVITDVAGRQLIHQLLPQQQSKCTVDIHDLASGLYLYEVFSGGILVNEGKLVKQ